MIKLSVRRTGACMFDVCVFADRSDMPALLPEDKQVQYDQKLRAEQNQAMMLLDAEVGKLSTDVVIGVFPWSIGSIVCTRSFSALVKEGQSCINAWIKACQGKLGKSLIVDG